ncbi:MAG: rhomboid family intramembrane serine protease [Candidatus Bostrichicola ureolyticus]|nr:MAG: rhomboid family intramembrane serine protease [Candidatus Bostrichicola ureolyticus]
MKLGVKNLIIINIIIYIAIILFPEININQFYLYNPLSQNFEFYQLFTHMFIHSKLFVHIIFNMLTLWMFGLPVEYIMGFKNLIIIYLFSGFIAALVQILFDISFLYKKIIIFYPMMGASGAISGLIGSFAYLFPNKNILILPIPFAININKALCIFIFISCIASFFGNHFMSIAHFAHIGGILGGYFITPFLLKKRYK